MRYKLRNYLISKVMETLSTNIPSYLTEGVGTTDLDAVRGYLAYIEQGGLHVDAIVVERTERGIVIIDVNKMALEEH